MTPYSDTNMRNGFTYTVDDNSGSFVESDIPSNMMSNGSNNGRGIDTSPSSTLGRDVAKGMNDNLNDVMRMTENIQSKYGDPNDKTVDQIMAEYNVNNAENAFQGMDNNRGLLQKTADVMAKKVTPKKVTPKKVTPKKVTPKKVTTYNGQRIGGRYGL